MRRKISSILFFGFLAIVSYYSVAVPFYTQAATDDVEVTGSVTAGISITASGDLELSAINGFTGGNASGDATWTVKTNNSAGYSFSVHKDQLFLTGAGGAGNQFSDYTEDSSGVPDFAWVTTADNATAFGFSIKTLGTDVVANQKFLSEAGSTPCNTGSVFTTVKCWIDIPTTTPLLIASRPTPTDTSGIATVIQIKAEIGAPTSGSYMTEGAYSTTVTATAATL